MSTTPDRAEAQTGPKPDSLRSTRVGAIWTVLPARDGPRLRATPDGTAPARAPSAGMSVGHLAGNVHTS
jgi:hypothetical protein